jgi:hypothetical protein
MKSLADVGRRHLTRGNGFCAMDHVDLTLREALALDRLEDFIQQEETRGVELASGSDLERALALLITRHRKHTADGSDCAGFRCGELLLCHSYHLMQSDLVVLR